MKEKKEKKQSSSQTRRGNYGKLAGLLGLFSNLLLAAAKFTVGMLSGSISVTADAMNNLADAGASVLTLVGFHMAEKPSDSEHPYGHGRMEAITGLCLSVSVIFIALQSAGESFSAILSPTGAPRGKVILLVLGLSVGVKLAQGVFYRVMARKIASPGLHAAESDSFSDAAVTLAVLFGCLLEKGSGLPLDGYFGLGVSVCIFITGIRLIRETSDPLLGNAPSPVLLQKIGERLRSYPGILGYHDLLVHDYGEGRIFASAHVEVDADTAFLPLHELLDRIEHDFRRDLQIQLVLHPDPRMPNDAKQRELLAAAQNAVMTCCPEATLHDFRALVGHAETRLTFDIALPSGIKEQDDALCRRISKMLQEKDPSLRTIITVDRNFTSTTSEN